MKQQKLLLSGSAIAILLAAVPVHALEYKISGQVNSAIISGDATDDLTVIDNNMTGSRFRFTGDQEIGNGLSVGLRYEHQLQANRSSDAGASGSAPGSEVRWSQVYLKGAFGKLAIGKSEGAASDVADATYGNGNFHSTYNLIFLAYRGAYRDKIGDETAGLFVPFDAASRSNSVQYHSPKFGGFTFAAGVGNQNETQIALRYQGKIAGGTLKARVGQRDNDADKWTAGSFLYQTSFGLNFGAGFGTLESNEAKDWNALVLGYKSGKFGASIEVADNDNDEEVTSFGVSYNPAKGSTIYFNRADFDVTSGVMLGMKVNF